MKKHLIVATGLAVLSTSAFASKARMQALGQGSASTFIDDTRSVFLNPSKLNSMNNFVTTEWGTSNAAADSVSAPHAEGGFFRKASSFSYGFYLGNESGANNAVKTTAAVSNTDNVADFFIAGDMGMKWGARLSYSSNESKPTGGIKKTSDTTGLGLGIEHGAIEAYANLALKDESKGGAAAGDKYEADMGMNLGASYDMGDMTFYADYDKSGYETNVAAVKTTDVETTSTRVGVAKTHNVSKASKMFCDLNYNMYESNDKQVTGATTKKTETTTLPLTIGFETEANSWLTLRASVSQNFVIGDSTTTTGAGIKTEQSIANSTDVNAGATFTFGKLMIDGVIGTTSTDRTATTASEKGNLATDNLMTRVAVNYWF